MSAARELNAWIEGIGVLGPGLDETLKRLGMVRLHVATVRRRLDELDNT